MNSTATPGATGTRTPARKRAKIVPAAQAGRQAQRRLAELSPKGRAPYAVLLAVLTEISMYSRLDDRMSIGRIMQVTGLDRRSAQRGLAYLVDHGIVARLHDPRQEGKGTPRAWIVIPAAPSVDDLEDVFVDDLEQPEAEVVEVVEDAPEVAPDYLPVLVTHDAPGGVTHDAPYEETFFEKKEKEVWANFGKPPSRASDVGQSKGPTSLAPGEAAEDQAQITDTDVILEDTRGLCDEALRAFHALRKRTDADLGVKA